MISGSQARFSKALHFRAANLSHSKLRLKGLRSESRTRKGCTHSSIVMAGSPNFEAWVKGDPDKNILGDCPFCHRALLTLEEKKASYEKHYINLKKKPDWLFDINPKGSVPAIKELDTGKWHIDSGEFVDFLEDKIPDPKLGKAEDAPEAGSKLLPKFVQYLDSTDKDAAGKKDDLYKEFSGLEEHLKSNGPFLKGNNVSAGDLALSPRLYHASVALKHFKDLDILADFPTVKDYFQKIESRDSWKNTIYSEEIVIAGWKQHIADKKA